MRNLILAAALLAAAPAVAVEVPGHYPTAANSTLTTSDPTATAAELASFLGAPDDVYTGLGGQWVTYNLGTWRVFDGPGQDFNVYEVDFGAVEFSAVDILVSADGTTFFNVESTFGAAVDLIGDNAHGNANFRRSFDLGGAVLALGASEFRYIRIAGTASGPISGSDNFDLDAIGLVNFREIIAPPPVPAPASLGLFIAGLGLVGAAARRRRTARA